MPDNCYMCVLLTPSPFSLHYQVSSERGHIESFDSSRSEYSANSDGEAIGDFLHPELLQMCPFHPVPDVSGNEEGKWMSGC